MAPSVARETIGTSDESGLDMRDRKPKSRSRMKPVSQDSRTWGRTRPLKRSGIAMTGCVGSMN